jgi:hypothetical protein
LFASIVISAISLVLFIYWFRYTCVLILNAKGAKDYADKIADANQLNFVNARTQLITEPSNGSAYAAQQLDRLHKSLDRDYKVVTYLLEHVANYSAGGRTLEQTILVVDFHIMRFCYWLVRPLSGALARRTLLEMASIVSHFANAIGERVAVSSKA